MSWLPLSLFLLKRMSLEKHQCMRRLPCRWLLTLFDGGMPCDLTIQIRVGNVGFSKNRSNLGIRLISSSKHKITIAGSEHDVMLVEHRDQGFLHIEYDAIPFEIFLGEVERGNRLALVDGIPLIIGEAKRGQGTFSLLVNDKRIQVSSSPGTVY